MKTECTLTNEELIAKAEEWISKLAKSGGDAWTLSVPVDFNKDPDMLFVELCKRLKEISDSIINNPNKIAELHDWTKIEDKTISVPDELDGIINKVGMQLRLHTISGKGEVQTVCHIVYNCQKFFKEMYSINDLMSIFRSIKDLRPYLLQHSDSKMVESSCLHYLGDAAQEWWQNKNKKKERTFTETEISHLQSAVHEITGDGEVMILFNKLLGNSAG